MMCFYKTLRASPQVAQAICGVYEQIYRMYLGRKNTTNVLLGSSVRTPLSEKISVLLKINSLNTW